MKKWIAALLAVLLVMSLLAGCSSDSKKDSKDPTQSQSGNQNTDKTPAVDGVAIDTLLDKPEKVYADESDNLFLDISTDGAEAAQNLQIGMTALADGSFVIYFNDGPAKTLERVTEISADGTVVTGYLRASGQTEFVKDTVSTTEELLTEAQSMLEMVEMLCLFSEDMDGAKLRKAAPIEAPTGKVYTYTIVEDGKDTGTVSFDQATGLVVYLADDTFSLTVKSFDLTSAKIPEYKTVSDGVAVGTVLDKPEVTLDTTKVNNLYLKLYQNGDTSQYLEVHIEDLQNETSGVFALNRTDGTNHVTIVVEVANGTYTVYQRSLKDTSFTKTNDMTAEEVAALAESVNEFLNTFVTYDWDDKEEQVRKIESSDSNVLAYEVLEGGQVTGTIKVDKTTGLILETKDADLQLTITAFSLSESKLPAYK